MTDFIDKFDRADEVDMDGLNGWNVLSPSPGFVELFDTYATNGLAARECFVYQDTTLPSGFEQEIRAKIACTTEHAGSFIGIGCEGDELLTNPLWGYGAYIHWNTSGVRSAGLYTNKLGGYWASGTNVNLRKTMVPVLEENGTGSDLNVIQQLRVRIKAVEGGTRIRVYINNEDNGAPDMEHIEPRDSYGTGYGKWYFWFGIADPARVLLVGEVAAFDTQPDSTPRSREGALTLTQITSGARSRYAGSSRDDFDGDLANDFANDAQLEVLHNLGDMAYFLNVVETFLLTVDSDGFTELEDKVERVISIRNANTEKESRWEATDYTTSGNLRVRIDPAPSGDTYRLTYRLRPERMSADHHTSVIPREHGEVLKVATAMRMAQFDSNTEHYLMLKETYDRLLKMLKRNCNLFARQRKGSRMHSTRRRSRRARYESEVIDQWGY